MGVIIKDEKLKLYETFISRINKKLVSPIDLSLVKLDANTLEIDYQGIPITDNPELNITNKLKLGRYFFLTSLDQLEYLSDVERFSELTDGLLLTRDYLKKLYSTNKNLIEQIVTNSVLTGQINVFGVKSYEGALSMVNALDLIENIENPLKKVETRGLVDDQDWFVTYDIESLDGSLEKVIDIKNQFNEISQDFNKLENENFVQRVREEYEPVFDQFGNISDCNTSFFNPSQDEPTHFKQVVGKSQYFVFNSIEGFMIARFNPEKANIVHPHIYTKKNANNILDFLRRNNYVSINKELAEKNLKTLEANAIIQNHHRINNDLFTEEDYNTIKSLVSTGKVGDFQRLKFIKKYKNNLFDKAGDWEILKKAVYEDGYIENLPVEIQLLFLKNNTGSQLVSQVLANLNPKDVYSLQKHDQESFRNYFKGQSQDKKKSLAFLLKTKHLNGEYLEKSTLKYLRSEGWRL